MKAQLIGNLLAYSFLQTKHMNCINNKLPWCGHLPQNTINLRSWSILFLSLWLLMPADLERG